VSCSRQGPSAARVNSSADTRAAAPKDTSFYVGTKVAGYGFFVGVIDEVAIYAKALATE